MADGKCLILITGGGNSGVGFELAAQLLTDSSKHILLGCRSVERGNKALEDLSSRALPGTVELLQLDVADDLSVQVAAQQVEEKHGRLDALVNNAAIGSVPSDDVPLSIRMLNAFRTNAVGVLLVVEAFLPLLRKATSTPRIINVSSGAGSVSRTLDPKAPNLGLDGIPYSSSKAAMNLITAQQIRTYGSEGVKVFAYSPGFVVSNLGPYNNKENGAQPTNVGAAPMVRILNGERDDEHGNFLRAAGTSPW